MSTTPTSDGVLAAPAQRTNFRAMPPRRKTSDFVPMNALSRLIHRRKAELDLSWHEIAERGGFSSHTIVYMLAKKVEHRQTPRQDTLERLSRALDLPLDVINAAAAAAAGLTQRDTMASLEASQDARMIVDILNQLPERDRAKLRRLAMALLEDSQADAQVALTPEQAALRGELSQVAAKVRTARRAKKS